jgi:hypothetical protein
MVNSIPAGSRILDEDLAPWRTQINSNTAPGWTSYTPTWTGATTNPVLGNGTITGQYRRSANGDIVHWWLRILVGSTTTFGTLGRRQALGGASGVGARLEHNGELRHHGTLGLRVEHLHRELGRIAAAAGRAVHLRDG